MQNSDLIKSKLVLIGYHEGKKYGGNIAGQAIMWALANRVRTGMCDWQQAINTAGEYTQVERVISQDMPNPWDASLLALVQAVDDIYDGRGKDISDGGLFWCDTAEEMNEFFRQNVVKNPDLRMVMQMGSLAFYGAKERQRVGKGYFG